MKATVLFTPTEVTNLLREARLIKTALLFSANVDAKSAAIESLLRVNELQDADTTEFQYEVILNAMPVLNPEASVAPMKENLQQIKRLKNSNRKSSKEIVALKKAQNQLKQINNTFRIITETLFQASQFSEIVPLVNKKVWFSEIPSKEDTVVETLFLVSEEIMENHKKLKLKLSSKAGTFPTENEIRTLPIYTSKEFDQFSVKSLLAANKVLQSEFKKLVVQFQKNPKNSSMVELEAIIHSLSPILNDFPYKKSGKSKQEPEIVTINLGVCTPHVFEQLISPSHNFKLPQSKNESFVFFLYNQTLKKVKRKATKQAVLQE